MDIILSIARNTCYYNNSVRLVIVSATMNDDEPIYRSYYQCINDNLLYPIKTPFLYDDLEEGQNTSFLPNTLYIDRRFDISPPGETTQYKITEIYKDLEEKGGSSYDAQNSIIAQEESYKVILEICNQSPKGEILLFLTGEGEIKKAVEYLNKKLPQNDVALPYYSNMNQKYKDYISKIDENIFKIRNLKTKIYEEWGEKFISDIKVPEGLYKRAIIVATNVAEASVTIPRLEFVVDTGYSKESIFDEELNISKLIVSKISESSRVQRKGRVGRIGDGTVYYMYKKGARKNVKPKYNINNENMKDHIFKYSSMSNEDDVLDSNNQKPPAEIYPMFYDPHFHTYFDNERKEINGIKISSLLFYKFGIYDLVNRQFGVINNSDNKEEFFPSPYYEYFKEERNKKLSFLTSFQDMYPINTLLDLDCIFYIIHPKEKYIIRNCMNKMIQEKVVDKNIEKIIPRYELNLKYHYGKMLNNLKLEFKILDINGSLKIDDSNNNYRKTIFGTYLEKLQSITMLSSNMCITLMNAYGHNILDEVILIISFLEALNRNSVKTLAIKKQVNDYLIQDFDKIKNRYRNDKSDLIAIYKIVNLIKNNFSDLIIFNKNKDIKKYAEDIYIKKRDNFLYYINNKNYEFDPPSELKLDWNLFKKLMINGKIKKSDTINLKTDTGFLSWYNDSKYFSNYISDEIKNNELKIKKFCKSNNFDYLIIKNFLKIYVKNKINIETLNRNDDIKNKEDNSFDWIDKNFKNNFRKLYYHHSIEEKIILSFLAGNPTNIAFKRELKDNNYQIMTTLKIAEIGKISKNKNNMDINSFINNSGSLIFFLSNDTINNFQIITNITEKDLIKVNPFFYNPLNFTKIEILEDNFNNKKIIELRGSNYEKIIFNIHKYWKSDNSFVWFSEKSKDENLIKYILNTKKNIEMKYS